MEKEGIHNSGPKKTLFNYKISNYRKFLNRLGPDTRGFYHVFFITFIITSPFFFRGIRRGMEEDRKSDWYKTCVRDPDSQDFDYIDNVVEPPQPLEDTTSLGLFRKEFEKLRAQAERG